MADKDSDIQAALEAGRAPEHQDASAYQVLFQALGNDRGAPLPGGFSFRVMDRIITIRLRAAERQAQRLSLLAAILLIAAAALGLLVSVQFGWTSGAWLTRLPLVHLAYASVGFLLLAILDSVFETKLYSPDRTAT